MKILLFLGLILLVLLVWYLYRRFILKEDSLIHLPLQELGYRNVPAFPFSILEAGETLLKLSGRNKEVLQAKYGLSETYTIQGQTAPAYSFVFGADHVDSKEKVLQEQHLELSKQTVNHYRNGTFVKVKLHSKEHKRGDSRGKLTGLSLDKPDQFALAWTTFGNILRDSRQHVLPEWSKSLTDPEAATQQFFPTIAQYGVAYNLIFFQKVTSKNIEKYRQAFPKDWSEKMDQLAEQGLLFILDLRIYEILETNQVDGFERFTPATFTWLEQDKKTKHLLPFAISVAGKGGIDRQFYDRPNTTDAAWLYALQAVKVSVTVYGIYLGHVYHWHSVTAAMDMTLLNHVPEDHSIRKILGPQSNYLIGFNDVLFLLWAEIAPSTSINTALEFINLTNTFAEGRTFFDDDPLPTLKRLGLEEKDFTLQKPWDQYPVVGYLVQIWEIVGEYVETYVKHTYSNDAAVQQDQDLQTWIRTSSDPDEGNIRGLPSMDSREAVKRVLHSMLYRVTAHGLSRLNNSANPSLSFVANFPPCLQSSHIPSPQSTFDTKELLQYLPNTGTIGQMINFYYTFADSAPYEPIIPLEGVSANLFLSSDQNDPRNQGLLRFRERMVDFMQK